MYNPDYLQRIKCGSGIYLYRGDSFCIGTVSHGLFLFTTTQGIGQIIDFCV